MSRLNQTLRVALISFLAISAILAPVLLLRLPSPAGQVSSTIDTVPIPTIGLRALNQTNGFYGVILDLQFGVITNDHRGRQNDRSVNELPKRLCAMKFKRDDGTTNALIANDLSPSEFLNISRLIQGRRYRFPDQILGTVTQE